MSKVLRNRAIARGEKISSTFRNENGIRMQTACIVKYDPEIMRERRLLVYQRRQINGTGS